MAKSSSIALLQPPPAWALASSVDSDWVLRQKWMREEFGVATFKLNRHQRKNRLKQLGSSGGNGSDCGGTSSSFPGGGLSSSSTGLFLTRSGVGGSLMAIISTARIRLFSHIDGSSNIRAIIASGTGPDGLSEARKSRKKRRFIVQTTAVIAISMLVMKVMKSWNYQNSLVGEGGQGDERQHHPLKVDDENWTNDNIEEECNPSTLSSLTRGNFSATFDNNSVGSNDICGADNKEGSVVDRGDADCSDYLEGMVKRAVIPTPSKRGRNACDRGGDVNYYRPSENSFARDLETTQINIQAGRSRADDEPSCIDDEVSYARTTT